MHFKIGRFEIALSRSSIFYRLPYIGQGYVGHGLNASIRGRHCRRLIADKGGGVAPIGTPGGTFATASAAPLC